MFQKTPMNATDSGMDEIFDHWCSIQGAMLAQGLSGRMTVQLLSDDFDFHLSKGYPKEEIQKCGGLEAIEWFVAHGITFVRVHHSMNN